MIEVEMFRDGPVLINEDHILLVIPEEPEDNWNKCRIVTVNNSMEFCVKGSMETINKKIKDAKK